MQVLATSVLTFQSNTLRGSDRLNTVVFSSFTVLTSLVNRITAHFACCVLSVCLGDSVFGTSLAMVRRLAGVAYSILSVCLGDSVFGASLIMFRRLAGVACSVLCLSW